jgi:hypothetical protein
LVCLQLAKHAPNLGDFEFFRLFQCGQDPGQATRQHGLATTRRTREQEMVASRRRHLQGSARSGLAIDLAEVMDRVGRSVGNLGDLGLGLKANLTAQMCQNRG